MGVDQSDPIEDEIVPNDVVNDPGEPDAQDRPDGFAAPGDLSDAVAQTLAQESPDAIAVVDAQGRVVWVNHQAEQLFGYGQAELYGQTLELLLPDGVQNAHVTHRASYMESPRTRPMGFGLDLKARRRGGATFPVEISLTPFATDRGHLVIATVRDISERKVIDDEQAALRRVATLVAGGPQPEEVFAAVTDEVGRVLGVDFTSMSRYEPGGAVTIVGSWARAALQVPFPIGTHLPSGGANIHTRVFQTRQPTRFDAIVEDVGPELAPALAAGIRASVGVPITVEGQLWGVIISFFHPG